MSSTTTQRRLGKSNLQVGPIGFGTMMMTWCDPSKILKDEDAFKAIKASVDAGANFINSGAFYGNMDHPTANLELLKRFFDEYPEYINKVVLSVKGGCIQGSLLKGFSSSIENLREDMARIKKALGDKKKMDIYEVARVDPTRTIEETMANLVTLKNEGYFDHIGVSEIHPSALQRANAVHPIAAVEIELSLFALEPEALETVKVAEELDIAVIAYSPLGKGMLTGRYKSADDFPPEDFRRTLPKFQGDNFKINLQLVDKLNEIAKQKHVTGGQLALAYLLGLSDKVIPIPGSGSVARIHENTEAANVKLLPDERAAIEQVLSKFESLGDRYPNNGHGLLWGKGKEV